MTIMKQKTGIHGGFKHALILSLCLIMPFVAAEAQDNNGKADNILGKYLVIHEAEESKVEVTRQPDGTYRAQMYWVKNAYDKDGKKRTDEKNPDKSMRSTPCDEIVLFWDLRYNAEKHRWEKGKVYDPLRGIKANLSATIDKSGDLLIRGSLMGFSQTVVWKPLDE